MANLRNRSDPNTLRYKKLTMLHGERWSSLETKDKTIFVSSLGRVAYDKKGVRCLYSQSSDKCGYMRIKQQRGLSPLVHRLVALAFIGNIPDDMEINHKNGNKQDNRVENLEIVSHKQNMNHAKTVLGVRFDGMKGKYGKKHHLSMPVLCYDLSGVLIREYESVRMAAKECGLNFGNIAHVCNGDYGHRTCGGYLWKYKV